MGNVIKTKVKDEVYILIGPKSFFFFLNDSLRILFQSDCIEIKMDLHFKKTINPSLFPIINFSF